MYRLQNSGRNQREATRRRLEHSFRNYELADRNNIETWTQLIKSKPRKLFIQGESSRS